MGEDQLDDLDLDGPITLRILDGSAWNHPSKMMEDRDRELWQFDLELGHNNPHEKVKKIVNFDHIKSQVLNHQSTFQTDKHVLQKAIRILEFRLFDIFFTNFKK